MLSLDFQSLFTLFLDFSASSDDLNKITPIRYLRVVVTGLSRDNSTEYHYH